MSEQNHHHDHEHHHHHEHCGCGHDHHHDHSSSLDDLSVKQGLTIEFFGTFNASPDLLWKMLTENSQLKRWYPGLEFKQLKPGGSLLVKHNNGELEEMMVLDVEPSNYLSFAWGMNTISLQLKPSEKIDQTDLIFTKWLADVEEKSAEEVTNWMVHLHSLANLLEEKAIVSYEEKYQELYPQVVEMINQQNEFEF